MSVSAQSLFDAIASTPCARRRTRARKTFQLLLLCCGLWQLTSCSGEKQAPRKSDPTSVKAHAPVAAAPVKTPAQKIPAQPAALSPAKPPAEKSPEVQKIYRPSDSRPARNDGQLAHLGIRKYESERMILYTDIPAEQADPLRGIIDQAYGAWVDYFGELPPNREGTPYQVTGFVIGDLQRFIAAGILPEGPPMFNFGFHRGAEFWMNNQGSDYYRRHLLIHEATHCFMTTMLNQYPPRWYLEGMAELFATHTLHPDGRIDFRVMPQNPEDFSGLGRIELIQQEVANQRLASLPEVGLLNAEDWAKLRPTPYAWGWAICKLLDDHPRYQSRFRELGQHLEWQDFDRFLTEQFSPDRILMAAEWNQFARRLEYGYDVAASAFITSPEPLQPLREEILRDVPANLGWQSTGLTVTAGQRWEIVADGNVVLDQNPRPWVSEPPGISIDYAAGEPFGRLLAAVVPESLPQVHPADAAIEVFSVGHSTTHTSRQTGELWLRVNDAGDNLLNNSGVYHVRIRPRQADPSLPEVE